MKKTILILLAMFLSIGMFTSCEKDNPQLLSEFVIGKWQSQVVDLGDVETDIYFMVAITADNYYLSMTDGENSVDLPQAGYVVDDDANTITIDQPQFPDDDPSDEVVSFKVTWEEGGNTMTWLPIDPLENDTPTLVWTLSTGM